MLVVAGKPRRVGTGEVHWGKCARSARGAQVLVDGLAADAELTSQCCLRGTVAGPPTQFGHPIDRSWQGSAQPFTAPIFNPRTIHRCVRRTKIIGGSIAIVAMA